MATSSLRVLVVDDNADYTDSVAALLKLKGHQVFVAYGVAEGLELADKVLPHLVLHDIGFTDVSGYDVAKKLREDARFNQTLLVAVTGLEGPIVSISSSEAGFDRHVTKPISYKCMLELLTAAAAHQPRAQNAGPAKQQAQSAA